MTESFEQLSLAVALQDQASFNNFYIGKNQLLINELRRQLNDGERFMYLVGAKGSGRSHLLQAACHHADQQGKQSQYLPLQTLKQFPPEQVLANLDQLDLVCLDDIQVVIGKPDWEEALFHLFNRLAEQQVCLLVAADQTPREIPATLADLSSRLSWGSLYQIKNDNDDHKAVVQFRAQLRGIELPEEVIQFIDYRCQRDTETLMAVLDTLDKASLKEKRKLTIPFVKSVMQW